MNRRTACQVIALCSLAAVAPAEALGQNEASCRVGCGVALGTTAFVAATGVVAGYARARGGVSTTGEALWIWGSAFTLVAGGGLALAGDGRRQRRAVYASGLAMAGGGLIGLAATSILGDATPADRLTGALVGAAGGALVGGVVGALTYDGGGAPGAAPMISLTLPF